MLFSLLISALMYSNVCPTLFLYLCNRFYLLVRSSINVKTYIFLNAILNLLEISRRVKRTTKTKKK
jgi:hypothetical protein